MQPSSTPQTIAVVLPAFFGERRLPIHPSGVGNSLHRSVEAEVEHIATQQARGKGRRIIESTQDTGDVIKRYRVIESLVRQLQVGIHPFMTRENLTKG